MPIWSRPRYIDLTGERVATGKWSAQAHEFAAKLSALCHEYENVIKATHPADAAASVKGADWRVVLTRVDGVCTLSDNVVTQEYRVTTDLPTIRTPKGFVSQV